MPYVIRTSDRQQFKRCRRLWDLGSKIRQNYEPNRMAKPLSFGIAIHEALQVYYNPKTWHYDREVVEALTEKAFNHTLNEQVNSYLKLSGNEALNEEDAVDFAERRELGNGMLQNYFGWAPGQDEGWIPKYVEIEFEVPVVVPEGTHLPEHGFEPKGDFRAVGDNRLLFIGSDPVVYQGRLDCLFEDPYGKYWIWDHKTTAQFGDTSHLELDEQCGSYCWAIQVMLGVRVEGVIYNELFKAYPKPPDELKKGGLSKNKQQNTTHEVYLAALREKGLNRAEYEEFLDHLKSQGNKFFRRIQVHRNQHELQNLQDRICLEAIDMLNSPSIYPNPTRVNCSGCSYRTPCLAINDNSDLGWILKENYHKRNEQEEEPLVNSD